MQNSTFKHWFLFPITFISIYWIYKFECVTLKLCVEREILILILWRKKNSMWWMGSIRPFCRIFRIVFFSRFFFKGCVVIEMIIVIISNSIILLIMRDLTNAKSHSRLCITVILLRLEDFVLCVLSNNRCCIRSVDVTLLQATHTRAHTHTELRYASLLFRSVAWHCIHGNSECRRSWGCRSVIYSVQML